MDSAQQLPRSETLPEGWLIRRAAAKLNLSLRVLGGRPDGLHELDSVAAKITLYDELRLRRRGDGQINLVVEDSRWDCGPADKNLVIEAALVLRGAVGQQTSGLRLQTSGTAKKHRSRSPQPEARSPKTPGAVAAASAATLTSGAGGVLGADIVLTKRIPPGAGLGGGSSDAAAVLAGLNQLWHLGLSQAQLAQLGSAVGSDVPLFFDGPAVRMTGRGEKIEPFQVHPFWAVLYLPGRVCPTAEVYATYDALGSTGVPPVFLRHRPEACATNAIRNPQLCLAAPPSQWRNLLVNDLFAAAMQVCPPLLEAHRNFSLAAGVPVHLTGSGSGLFLLADDQAEAKAVLSRLPPELAGRCVIVRMNEW